MEIFKTKRQGMRYLVLMVLLPLSLAAAIKEVQLKSGERLLGKVLPGSDAQTLFLRSKVLGDLKLPRSSIASTKDLPAPKPPVTPKLVVAAKPPPEPEPGPELAPGPPKPMSNPQPTVTEAERKERLHSRIWSHVKGFKTPPSWSGNLRLGLNINAGSSNWTEQYARGQLSIKPEGSKNFYRLGGSYSLRENENNNGTTRVTSDKHDLSALYRRSFFNSWFLQNALGYRVDNIKGIENETKYSLGAGYIIKFFKDKVEFNLGSGFGIEDYQSSNAADLRNGQNQIGNVFQELTWKISKRATISQKFNYFRNLRDGDLYDYHFSTAFRARLTDVFGLELSYRKDFDSEVGRKKKDDTQWRSAFVVYF